MMDGSERDRSARSGSPFEPDCLTPTLQLSSERSLDSRVGELNSSA